MNVTGVRACVLTVHTDQRHTLKATQEFYESFEA